MIDPGIQEKAAVFIKSHARPLEQALYAYHFEDGAIEAVFDELAKFQNDDGGFGHGLEPDLRYSGSSVLATTVALQKLASVNAGGDHPMVKRAMFYLMHTYEAGSVVWPIIPQQAESAPHAPWWRYDPDLSNYLLNPRAEIAGYMFRCGNVVPEQLRDGVTGSVLKHLEEIDGIEMHELLCCVRMVEYLPEDLKARAVARLEPLILETVATSGWEGYVLKPIQVAPRPDATFAGLLNHALEANLDYEITQQGDDGAWLPPWSWGDDYPDAWVQARREWQGMLTLDMLLTLRAYGRL